VSERKRERHGMSKSAEYRSWQHAKVRCFNVKFRHFANYGGRGITMCAEWCDSFAAFVAHIGPRPAPGYTVDRIDNAGNYEPGNVRWATRVEQAANRRTSLAPDVDRAARRSARARERYLADPQRWSDAQRRLHDADPVGFRALKNAQQRAWRAKRRAKLRGEHGDLFSG
jgi:hypothetical protein